MKDFLNQWKVRIGLGTLVVMLYLAWEGYGVAHAYHAMITGTAQAVEMLGKQLAISKLEAEVANLRAERRAVRIEMKLDPQNTALMGEYEKQLEEITDDIEVLRRKIECVLNSYDYSACVR
jgi:flagellar basal body-associated protein FliL